MIEIKDEFLSEEDLDLKNMSEEELYAYWNYWLEQAQATNEMDRVEGYSCPPEYRRPSGNISLYLNETVCHKPHSITLL